MYTSIEGVLRSNIEEVDKNSSPAPLQEGGAGKPHVEWRKPLEVEADEGLSVGASDLYQEEDYPDK